MYKRFKKYLEISPREFRGMVVFVFIMLLIYISPYIYERIMFEPLKISIEVLKPRLTEIETFDERKDNFYDEGSPAVRSQLFDFNPNDLAVESWVKLGLTEKQALSIKKYEAKGGEFRSVADVKKMYAISPQLFKQLEPHIKIPPGESKYKDFSDHTKVNGARAMEVIHVELNGADSLSLMTVRGIGPSFASRILKYRDKLGGFIAVSQLKEVYGIDSVKFAQIVAQVTVSPASVRKIDINHCTFDDIKYFPYLRYKQANAIIEYRRQHGDFRNIEDLKKIAILTPDFIKKVSPYLRF